MGTLKTAGYNLIDFGYDQPDERRYKPIFVKNAKPSSFDLDIFMKVDTDHFIHFA